MTTNVDASPAALRILVVLFLAVAGACGSGGGVPGSVSGGGPLRLTLTVRPSQEAGRTNASVKIESDAPLSAGQLSFGLPESCKIVAGAGSRTINAIASDAAIQQELAFECPAGTAGELTVSLSAKDASGNVVSSSVSAKL
jgi:hypothetical protein